MKKGKKSLILLCIACIMALTLLPVCAEESSAIAIQSLEVTKEGFDGEVTPYTDNTDVTFEFAYAYDNDPATRMSILCSDAAPWGKLSLESPLSLVADLGQSYLLDRIDVTWLTNANKRAYQYDVLVSTDGTEYTEVVSRSGDSWQDNNLGEVEGALNTVSDSLSEQVEARYVKIEVSGVTDNSFCAIYEICAFGTESTSEDPGTSDPGEQEDPAEPENPNTPEPPVNTGDANLIICAAAVLLLGAFGIRFGKARRNS